MMKFGDLRINPDHVKNYFPLDVYPEDYTRGNQPERFDIVFNYRDGTSDNVKYDTAKERDEMLEAIDETLLILKDGERVVPSQLETMFIDPFGGSGPDGLSMQ